MEPNDTRMIEDQILAKSDDTISIHDMAKMIRGFHQDRDAALAKGDKVVAEYIANNRIAAYRNVLQDYVDMDGIDPDLHYD